MDRRVVQANVALTDEEVVPLEDGERTYLSVKCPLWDETGKPYAVFGVSTDITDRKRIEGALVESRTYYQALAESLPHLVWTCRADGYCDYLSRQWVAYTGRPAEEQLGERLGGRDPSRRPRPRRAGVGARGRSAATPTTRSSGCAVTTAPTAGSARAACRCSTRRVRW